MPEVIDQKWTRERANAWWDARPWVCGANFLPSSAVNFLEMWMGPTFDRDGIKRELALAAETGFNSVRTNPHFLVWKHDRDGLLDRMDWFFETAADLGISTMPTLFDDCGFGGFEPTYGPQPAPVPNLHNSRAVASPGRAAVMDRSQWPALEDYITDVISHFRNDDRVLLWDLYNEPGNGMVFQEDGTPALYDPALYGHAHDLMLASFDWARRVNPSQPLTVGAWRSMTDATQSQPYNNPIDRDALELSDIVTIHAYCDRAKAERLLDQVSAIGRPILVTEWLARNVDSTFENQLPLYRERKVGCYIWGMVNGRTQTHRPWPHVLAALPKHSGADLPWFHDVFNTDGSAYDEAEVSLIRSLAKPQSSTTDGEPPCPA